MWFFVECYGGTSVSFLPGRLIRPHKDGAIRHRDNKKTKGLRTEQEAFRSHFVWMLHTGLQS